MHSHNLLFVIALIACSIVSSTANSIRTLEEDVAVLPADQQTISERARISDPQLLLIKEDIIPDVENTTQKVIRVNPQELPSAKEDPKNVIMESSLYQIQSLMPPNRKYVNSNRMRKPKPTAAPSSQEAQGNVFLDSPIRRPMPESKFQKSKQPEKQLQKHRHMEFLYKQADLGGNIVDKTMQVRLAPGAYPIYYILSKTNGRFGKYPLKSFRNEADYKKFLIKSKLAPIDVIDEYIYDASS